MVSLICPVAFLLFGIWLRFSTLSMSSRDATFPNLVAYVTIFCAIMQLIQDLKNNSHKARFTGVSFPRLIACTAGLFLYAFLLRTIGFPIGTFLLLMFIMWILGYRKYKVIVLASLAITAVVYGIFGILLNVPLPTVWL